MPMGYIFSREPDMERVVFALHLDRKKNTERIIVGTEYEAQRRMENPRSGDVFYDATRKLGELLVQFPQDPDAHWNIHLSELKDSYRNLTQTSRWSKAEPHRKFLEAQYGTGDPVLMFMAVRAWQYYLLGYSKNHGPDYFDDYRAMLTRPLRSFNEYNPLWSFSLKSIAVSSVRDEDEKLQLMYPSRHRNQEYALATFSFFPLFYYYMARLQDWGLLFLKCEICGTRFLAINRHYKFCGDECRKEQNRRTKQKFDATIEEDDIEWLHNQYDDKMYNLIRRVRKMKTAYPKWAAAMEDYRKKFQTVSLDLKRQVKYGKLDGKKYSNWLISEENKLRQQIEKKRASK